jgi:hypothetical protein
MKKHSGDEPLGVVVNLYMGMSQRSSLHRYLYLKQAKMSFFSVFPYKIREQEGGRGPVERGGLVKVGWERWWGKGIEG